MVANRGRRKTRYQGVFHVAQGNLCMDLGSPGSGLFVFKSMNKTEKDIEYQLELKTFRKAMYLVEREVLTGWRKAFLSTQSVLLFIVTVIVIGVFADEDLSFVRQLLNLLVFLLVVAFSFSIHWSSKLLLKWLQVKKNAGYTVDFAFKCEKNRESVKI